MARRMVGEGLGLKPIGIDDPYEADSGFDSTMRVPIRRAAAAPALGGGTTAIGSTQPRGFPIQPPTPSPTPSPGVGTTPPEGSMEPQSWNPQLLNFEGHTYGGPAPQATVTGVQTKKYSELSLDQQKSLSNIVDQVLGKQYGYTLSKDWRSEAENDPEQFYGRISHYLGPDATKSMLDPLYTGSQLQSSPEGQINFLGQSAFNNGIARLKQVAAQGSRDDEEQLMAALQARGLAGSGAATAALERFRQDKLDNFYSAVNNLNQLLVSGEITRLTDRDMATLQSDLQKRNAESLAKIQGALQLQIQRAGQPSALAQLGGTALGIGLSSFLSPKAPGADQLGSQLYTNPKNYAGRDSLFNLKTGTT